ncbi:MAG: response regulator transcription factor [Burkholderiaceae bacterium]
MLHIVDNSKQIRDLISSLAISRAIPVATYGCCETFLAKINDARIHDTQGECLLLDIRIPIMTSVALFYELSLRDIMQRFSVIFMTNPGDLPIGADMLKRIAFDLFEKPFDYTRLMDRVEEALEVSRLGGATAKIQHQLTMLTMREKEVLDLIVAGTINKVIGNKLGISARTVEIHRANIFNKMQVKNAVELARMLK